MKKRVIHVSYFFNKKSNFLYSDLLYSSKSFLQNQFTYNHFYYALNLAHIDENKTVLDLGCADGPFLPTLNRYGNIVIGLDFSQGLLSRAKSLLNHKNHPLKKPFLLNSDARRLPFKENCIDIIFCLETFEHVPNSIELIEEIFRILKPNGELIYSIPIVIGFALLLRQFIKKILRLIKRGQPLGASYTLKELFINGFLKKPPKERNYQLLFINNEVKFHYTHKNFDWRNIQLLINKKFKQVKVIYSPFPFLKSINPTVIFKVIKANNE